MMKSGTAVHRAYNSSLCVVSLRSHSRKAGLTRLRRATPAISVDVIPTALNSFAELPQELNLR
jgi:hypothetical protein